MNNIIILILIFLIAGLSTLIIVSYRDKWLKNHKRQITAVILTGILLGGSGIILNIHLPPAGFPSAWFGSRAIGAASTETGAKGIGSLFVMNATTGSPNNITAYISTTANRNYAAAIYSASKEKVATFTIRTIAITTGSWQTFIVNWTKNASVLRPNQNYYLTTMARAGIGTSTQFYTADAGALGVYSYVESPFLWDDSAAFDTTVDADGRGSIYCNYTIVNPSTVDVQTPANNSHNINFQPSCNVWANDTDAGASMTVTFWTNMTGTYVMHQKNTSISSGTIVRWNFSEAVTGGKKYYWKVYVNDGIFNISEWYCFTTRNKTMSFIQIADIHISRGGGIPDPTWTDGRMDDLTVAGDNVARFTDLVTKYNNTPVGRAGASSYFPEQALNDTINYTNAHDTGLSFVVETGDIVSQSAWSLGKNESLNTSKVCLDRFDIPYYIMGARLHDDVDVAGIKTRYESLFSQALTLNFTINGTLFILLSETGTSSPYINGTYMNNTLKRYADRGYNAIIFTHASSSGLMYRAGVTSAEAIQRAILMYHKSNYSVIVQVSAHNHKNEYVIRDGIHYLTTTALMNYPIEYRRVDVFNDYIHLYMVQPTSTKLTDLNTDSKRVMDDIVLSGDSALTYPFYDPDWFAGMKQDRDFYIGTDFVTAAQTLSRTGGYYTLGANISVATSYGFNVTADNVTLDLGHYYLNGTAANQFLVYVNGYDNFTLRGDYRGGFMRRSHTAVYLNNSDGFYMEYVNITNATRAVFIKNSDNGDLYNITLRNSGQTFLGNGSLTFEASNNFTVNNLLIVNSSCGIAFKSNLTYPASDIDIVNCTISGIKTDNLSFAHLASGVACKRINMTSGSFNEVDVNLLAGDQLIRRWFVRIQTNHDGNKLGGVSVVITNKTGVTHATYTTKTNAFNLGNTSNLRITDYINNGGTRYYCSDYIFTGTYTGLYGTRTGYNATTSGNDYTENLELFDVYQDVIRNYGTDYMVWLGANISAYHVNLTLTGMNEATESISLWKRGSWSASQGLWQTYNGTRTGTNWTVHTFDIIRTILDDTVGNQTVNMNSNPTWNYTCTRAIPLRNTSLNKGYNFSAYNRVADTTLSAINTSIGTTAGESVARWNRTTWSWDVWVSGFGPHNHAVSRWDVILTKMESAKTWNT
jgi:hypothetical protein